MKRLFSFTICSLIALAVNALEIPEIFGDNMILQQKTQCKLWGWAEKGHYVRIVTGWDRQEYVVKADGDGAWKVEVQTPSASYANYTVSFAEYKHDPKSGNGKKSEPVAMAESKDVLVGEVWFCSGQSNMEMPLGGFWNCPVEGANETILKARKYNNAIRCATIAKDGKQAPQKMVAGKWEKADIQTASRFSACAYYFAETLVDVLDIPVGVINCSWGGSCVEGWLPKEILLTYPDGLVPMDDTDYHAKMVMYNGMLSPLAGYNIKGLLWNQGESNVGREKEYIERFSTMTRHWRKLWNQPNDHLPIYTVELPAYRYGNGDGIDAAKFRAAQHLIAKELEYSGCVCTSDLIYDYEIDQIHGCKKKEIGQRLAFLALTRDYGIEGLGADAPEFEYLKEVDANSDDQMVIAGTAVEKNANAVGKVLHLYFTNSTDGFDRMAGIEGFEAQDAEGKWHKAIVWSSSAWKDVERQGCYLTLACPEVKEIKNVRYCFKNFVIGNLHNSRGLPVVPFTTEK